MGSKKFEKINRENGTTILMVTHDVFSASYCDRIIFLKDGNLFQEIRKQEKSRKELYSDNTWFFMKTRLTIDTLHYILHYVNSMT